MNLKDKPSLPLKEFVDNGYLQELNRLFFHPAGLALALKREDGELKFDRIVDMRAEPHELTVEGVNTEMVRKALLVSQAVSNTRTVRMETLGFDIQPLRTNDPAPRYDLPEQVD